MKLDDYIALKKRELDRFAEDLKANEGDPEFKTNFEPHDYSWWEDEFYAYLECMDLMENELNWMNGDGRVH